MTTKQEVCEYCKEPEPGPNKNQPDYCGCTRPDWGGECIVCGDSPIIPITDMCGPHTFGEAATRGGNW